MLNIGEMAPDFTLPDADGNERKLSELRGKKVVLYFYPKDSTAGCTTQAKGFASLYGEFKAKNAEVVGISKDSVASHRKFADKYELPFVLLSDVEKSVINEYGVWQEKTMCGKTSFGVVRTTYIIDENGIITAVMPKVKASENPSDALALL